MDASYNTSTRIANHLECELKSYSIKIPAWTRETQQRCYVDPRSEAEIILIQLTDVRSDQAAASRAGLGWAVGVTAIMIPDLNVSRRGKCGEQEAGNM